MGHTAGQQGETGERRGFVAGFIESLQAQTDAEEVCAAGDGIAQRLAQSVRVQSGDKSATVATPGRIRRSASAIASGRLEVNTCAPRRRNARSTEVTLPAP